jgi:glycosyltransferase involved in cell wall biosynthesis
VAHAFPPTFGGVESHLWDISLRLAQRGHAVCCLVGGEDPSVETIGNVTVVRRPELTVQNLLARRAHYSSDAMNDSLLHDLSAIVADTIATFRPSHIHAHNAHHFAPELATALFRFEGGTSLLNSVHDRIGEHIFESVIDYNWQHVLYASHYLERSIPTTRKSSVFWLGIDLQMFSPNGECDVRFSSFERPIIFHPARLLRWKGVELGVRAFLKVQSRTGRGTLVLCASDNIVDDPGEVRAFRAELVALTRRHSAERTVRFLNFDRSRIGAAYRASDLIWYPTIDDEPFGLVPLEAMACEVPLIVSRSGGMVETVVHGERGLIVEKGDDDALAAAAQLLFEDEQLREHIVRRGAEYVRDFGVDSYVDKLETVYAEAVN